MTRTNRTLLWQLGAVAAAASLMGIAQAQSDQATAPTEASASVLDQYEAANARNGMDQQSDTTVDASMNAATETTADTSAAATDTAAPDPAAPKAQDQTVVVVPTTVDQVAVYNKAWAAVEEMPTTRDEVVAEAVYANQNGLITRGEAGAVNEDKGIGAVEQADQTRIARSTEMYMAKVDAKRQQFAAQEQERLNQLALQEQQRQQQLAQQQQQAQQQEQALAQPQQPQQ